MLQTVNAVYLLQIQVPPEGILVWLHVVDFQSRSLVHQHYQVFPGSCRSDSFHRVNDGGRQQWRSKCALPFRMCV